LILFTTSLSPNPKARGLARSLSSLFFGIYLNRGSKSFADIIGKAGAMGCSRACFITRDRGRPSSLKIASVSCSGWEWVPYELKLGKSSSKKVKQAREIGSSAYSRSRKLNQIFGLEKSPFGSTTDISYSNNKLSFKQDKKEVFWIEADVIERGDKG